ncbi:chemotaxis protein [Venenivibrio stagnispumantis]|uniref:Two-component system, chemotaxis family, response regulator CheV n=1 Tax=Venenivibrio stagnispumantis TaxID=407998 RepID=A0AA45WNK4_9AQUI|nr:chemotaxis protein [Venenivibrio stagnispumantis]MCW4573913.1 chemotaxis protein [Venenivibrio stagnispumantis]SMP18795.1 two-component system, chemotaxis family, response regulator CheV [Venenivibrio stagnispumantis]
MAEYGLPETLKTGKNELEIIDFRIFEDREDGLYEWILGVNVAKVKEVLRTPPLTKVPNMPKEVEGMAEIRGELIPVVSIAKWIGINEPPERKKYLLFMEFLREKVGVIIHAAKRIRRISWSDIKKAPDVLNTRLNGRITGVVDTEEGLLLILDFEGILHDMGLLKVFDVEKVKEIEVPHKLNILVAEDSPVARKIIKDILESAGHHVIITEDGKQAWDKLNELLQKAQQEGKSIRDYIDLVLTDIEMPSMDGLTLTNLIKHTPGFLDLPVIVNTTLSDEANKQKAFTVGADDFIVKFDAKSILEMINKHAKK